MRMTLLAMLVAAALGVAMPEQAGAAEPGAHPAKKPFPAVKLAKRLRGDEAVRGLAGKLPEVAAWYGMSAQAFARMLRQDRHAWLERDGRLLFVDDFEPPPEQATGVTSGGTTTEAAPVPLDQTFRLHSRPAAQRVIYLDFDGQTVTGTAWNDSEGLPAIDAKPFDLDGNPAGFSATELERIQLIWQRVAEDYAPFDVDVTTEEPPSEAIARSATSDPGFGTRVVVTRDWTTLTANPCNCGGFAYVGVYDDTTEYYKPAFVFYDRLGGGNEKYVAEAISHEAGHNLGLSHDGYNNGSTSTGYYQGHGSGATGWAPIMGVGYYRELTQWSKGEYAYATQTQDDLQLMQTYGLPPRADDHGDGIDTASPLGAVVVDGLASLSGGGVIGSRGDADVFRFETGGGALQLAVAAGPRGANLDIAATLLDAAGNPIAGSNPSDALGASLSLAALPAGTYYLKVDGTGKGDASTGYSDYASLGEYVVSGTATAPQGLPPVAVATVTTSSGSAPLTVGFSSGGSYDPDGTALSYAWDFGDGSDRATTAQASHTYTAPGAYDARLTVTDASGSVGTAQVTVTVAAPLPALRVADIALTTSSNRSGTRATATVKITDAAGKALGGVAVSGAWSGVVSGTASGVTGSKGTVKFTSPSTRASGTFTFSVTGAALTGYAYDEGRNLETSDSITR
jgi:PKD repeat protein